MSDNPTPEQRAERVFLDHINHHALYEHDAVAIPQAIADAIRAAEQAQMEAAEREKGPRRAAEHISREWNGAALTLQAEIERLRAALVSIQQAADFEMEHVAASKALVAIDAEARAALGKVPAP